MSESSGRVTNIKWAVNFLLPLSLLLPESEAFTWNIKVFLAITLWGVMGYAMELTDNLVVSLIMMFMYGLSGIVPLKAVLGPWTADPAWMTLGALIIVSIVQKTTILKRMAYYAAIHTNGSSAPSSGACHGHAGSCRPRVPSGNHGVHCRHRGGLRHLRGPQARQKPGFGGPHGGHGHLLHGRQLLTHLLSRFHFHSLQRRRARGEHCSLLSPVLRGPTRCFLWATIWWPRPSAATAARRLR